MANSSKFIHYILKLNMENDSLGLQLEKNFTKRLQANEVVVYSTKV